MPPAVQTRLFHETRIKHRWGKKCNRSCEWLCTLASRIQSHRLFRVRMPNLTPDVILQIEEQDLQVAYGLADGVISRYNDLCNNCQKKCIPVRLAIHHSDRGSLMDSIVPRTKFIGAVRPLRDCGVGGSYMLPKSKRGSLTHSHPSARSLGGHRNFLFTQM